MQLVSRTHSETHSLCPVPNGIKPLVRYETYSDKKCIEALSYLLIRPPRIIYSPSLIRNPSSTTHDMTTYSVPFDLTVYSPKEKCRYCILYLHGNSSSRMEGMNMVREIPKDVALACFDFRGCGNGTDDWITLGIKESKQANEAAMFLQQLGLQVVGWGRSMGAVSLLLSDIKIMVVDSAFCSLKQLCTSVAHKQVSWMPGCLFGCLFSCVFSLVSSDVKKKTQEEIDTLLIIDHVKREEYKKGRSIIFLSGDDDSVIDCSHSRRLFQAFQGQKELLIFEGTHNSSRARAILGRCFEFIEENIQEGGASMLPTSSFKNTAKEDQNSQNPISNKATTSSL